MQNRERALVKTLTWFSDIEDQALQDEARSVFEKGGQLVEDSDPEEQKSIEFDRVQGQLEQFRCTDNKYAMQLLKSLDEKVRESIELLKTQTSLTRYYLVQNQFLKERCLRYERIINTALESDQRVISFESKLSFMEI